jgi:hypothetical protein
MLINKIVRSFIKSRILDDSSITKGFNYWMRVLPGSEDYPELSPFQFTDAVNLFEAAIDKSQIATTEIDSVYPYITLRSRRSSANSLHMTPSSFSGGTETWVDFVAGYEGTDMPMGTEDVMDLAQDGMVETFNRFDQGYMFQSLGLIYNGDMSFEIEDITLGAIGWTQKMRIKIPVLMPNLSSRYDNF